MPVSINGSNTPTAGGAVYGDGTAYATTAAGTAGQVLTSAGASAPTWSTPSVGAMTLISTQTASASSAISWTGLGTYNNYVLVIRNFIPSATANITLVVGTGAGPTYITTSIYYQSSMILSSNNSTISSIPNGGIAYFDIGGGQQITSTTSGGYSAVINFVNMNATPASDLRMFADYTFPASASVYRMGYTPCTVQSETTAKTAIKLALSTGTITSGTASLYGISS